MKLQQLIQYILQGGVRWYANCGFSFRSSVSFGQERSSKSLLVRCSIAFRNKLKPHDAIVRQQRIITPGKLSEQKLKQTIRNKHFVYRIL